MTTRKSALGRGLDALIPDRSRSAPVDDERPEPGRRTVAIERLEPNPEQPRRQFDEQRLEDLAASVRAHGIIQPIVVVPLPGRPGHYRILAGERRWRAAQRAGLHDVPVVVHPGPASEPPDRLELALVENVQRADLNPIEEARAYQRLLELRDLTHEEVAQRVGKDRATVSNAVRLLGLPSKVQDLVVEGRLGMGHARALLGLPDAASMIDLAHEVVRRRLSVRACEAEVRRRARPVAPEADDKRRQDIIVGDLEERLRRALGTRVRLRGSRRGHSSGVIEIGYAGLDELNRILHLLIRGPHEP
jgi:ParB family chromosome partitioning protein